MSLAILVEHSGVSLVLLMCQFSIDVSEVHLGISGTGGVVLLLRVFDGLLFWENYFRLLLVLYF